ncbi:hypothetical protein DFH06DRAFT_1335365 [Mycena polygramma]|nr:hypothetical protein DFH06DRAFT_1335365 [Mycena polygramma]
MAASGRRTISDVETAIASFCEISQLVALANTSRSTRASVSTAIRSRYASLLRHYFGSALERFDAILLRSGGCITSSAARWIMSPFPKWMPSDLNLLVPRETAEELLSFLSDTRWKLSSNQWPLVVGSGIFRRFTRGNMVVTLTQTEGSSVFRHVAISSHTAGAIMLTPQSFLSFYPHDFASNNTTLRGGKALLSEHLPSSVREALRPLPLSSHSAQISGR